MKEGAYNDQKNDFGARRRNGIFIGGSEDEGFGTEAKLPDIAWWEYAWYSMVWYGV